MRSVCVANRRGGCPKMFCPKFCFILPKLFIVEGSHHLDFFLKGIVLEIAGFFLYPGTALDADFNQFWRW